MRKVLLIAVCLTTLTGTLAGQWNWQNPLPQGNTLNALHLFNSITLITVGDAETIMSTSDGGAHWDIKHHVVDSYHQLRSICFVNSTTGWIVGNLGLVLKTTDGGVMWISQSNEIIGEKSIWKRFFLPAIQLGVQSARIARSSRQKMVVTIGLIVHLMILLHYIRYILQMPIPAGLLVNLVRFIKPLMAVIAGSIKPVWQRKNYFQSFLWIPQQE